MPWVTLNVCGPPPCQNTPTYLTLHRIGVQLTHVAAPVVLRHRLDVQVPRVQVRMRDGDARVVRDDVLVDRLDRLCVRLHPADLRAIPASVHTKNGPN